MKKWMLWFKIFGIATVLLSVGFNNCAPNQMAAFRSGGLVSTVKKKAASFDDYVSEYGGEEDDDTPPVLTYELHQVSTRVDPLTNCNYGELDLIEAAVGCRLNIPLVLSVKDKVRELTLLKIDLNAGRTYAEVLAQLVQTYARTIQGPEVDVFICFDSDKDGKCTDEQIADLNALTAKLAGGQGVCPELAAGLVLIHKHHKFNGQATQTTVAVSDMAAEAIADILRNIDTQSTESGGVTELVLPLVHSDKNLCPRPVVRTDGCFAKGTKIRVAKDVELPIEKLSAGNRVLLADGRHSTIKRVVAGPEKKPMVMFETASGAKIMVTDEHPMATKNGVKLAKQVTIGDELKTADGKFTAISGISQREYKEDVYNFELVGSAQEADHLVVAEGLVSGELYLQNKLAHKPAIKGLASK